MRIINREFLEEAFCLRRASRYGPLLAVCTENLIRIDYPKESPNVGAP